MILITVTFACIRINKPLPNYYISIKYLPFTTETQLALKESEISKLNASRRIPLKHVEINSDSIIHVIMEKLKKLKKTKKSDYNLRMQCFIYEDSLLIDSFYLDSKARLVYSHSVYNKSEGIVDILFKNICRPLFSYYSLEESLYWCDEMQSCDDSIEFINMFGIEAFQQTDWKNLKEKSRFYKERYK